MSQKVHSWLSVTVTCEPTVMTEMLSPQNRQDSPFPAHMRRVQQEVSAKTVGIFSKTQCKLL